MNSRVTILNRLRQGGHTTRIPAPWVSRRSYADLAGQFAAALTAAGGEAHRAGDLDKGLVLMGTLLEEIGAGKAIASDQPPLNEVDLPARYPGIDWFIPGRSQGDLRSFAASVDVGLTGADAALAETGTIVVSSGPGRSRLTSLLPPVHIALVPVSCLTADIFTWLAARRGQWPTAVTMISGPSKTSDIEQTLVTGVHGPKRFIAILYQDANPRPPIPDP